MQHDAKAHHIQEEPVPCLVMEREREGSAHGGLGLEAIADCLAQCLADEGNAVEVLHKALCTKRGHASLGQ